MDSVFGPLRITQCSRLTESRDGDDLLLGFGFGASPSSVPHPQVANLGLLPASGPPCMEYWWYRGEVTNRIQDGIRIAECEDYTAAVVQVEESDPAKIRRLTREVYMRLLQAFSSARHSRIVRIWNYFPNINLGEGDQERYSQFSVGRAEAYDQFGLQDDRSPPGTAIGTHEGTSLFVIALASSLPFSLVENPRQLSAYCYPPDYGPRSPRFSRGGVLKSAGRKLFLASGTAAIVGHASTNPRDAVEQTRETLRNLGSLLDNAEVNFGIDALEAARVYVRNRRDLQAIRATIQTELGPAASSWIYLCGDICRRELLLEIDGVVFC